MVRKSVILTLLCLSPALATPILGASTGTGSQTVTFEELGVLTTDQPITNQFASFGVTFSSPSGVFANGQGGSGVFDGVNGFSGNYLTNYRFNGGLFIDAPDPNFVTIQFASVVSSATLAVISAFGPSFTYSSFLGAGLVDTFMTPGGIGVGNFYGFQNSAFDRIVIQQVQNSNSNNDAVYDTISFSPLANGAPELHLSTAGVAFSWLAGLCLMLSSRRQPTGA